MPPSDAECAILSILINTLGDGSLSESDANSRLPAVDSEDVSDAFDDLRGQDFIENVPEGGILLDPDEFTQWAQFVYDCDGWSQRRLRERLPHQWQDQFFGL